MSESLGTEGRALSLVDTLGQLLLRLGQQTNRLLHTVLEARTVFNYRGFEGKCGENHSEMFVSKNWSGKSDDILISGF